MSYHGSHLATMRNQVERALGYNARREAHARMDVARRAKKRNSPQYQAATAAAMEINERHGLGGWTTKPLKRCGKKWGTNAKITLPTLNFQH